MKIQTTKKHRFNSTTKINNVKVNWDEEGVAEISKELFEDIQGQYTDIFQFGEAPFVTENKETVQEVENKDTSTLEEALKTSNEKEKELEQLVEDILESNKELQDNYNKVCEELSEFRLENEHLKSLQATLEVTQNTVIPQKDIEAIVKIVTDSKTNLINTCEKLDFPKEEWDTLNQRNMALYILNKVYANANTESID